MKGKQEIMKAGTSKDEKEVLFFEGRSQE